jgi:hypothetical protein
MIVRHRWLVNCPDSRCESQSLCASQEAPRGVAARRYSQAGARVPVAGGAPFAQSPRFGGPSRWESFAAAKLLNALRIIQ